MSKKDKDKGRVMHNTYPNKSAKLEANLADTDSPEVTAGSGVALSCTKMSSMKSKHNHKKHTSLIKQLGVPLTLQRRRVMLWSRGFYSGTRRSIQNFLDGIKRGPMLWTRLGSRSQFLRCWHRTTFNRHKCDGIKKENTKKYYHCQTSDQVS